MPKFMTVSDLSEFIEKLNEYLYDPKPSHLMTVGTLMAGYFLYQNYHTVLTEKRRRRALSEMSPDPHGIQRKFALATHSTTVTMPLSARTDCPVKSKKHRRGIFRRILTFDGIFDNTQSLNQILSKVWVPSIERGLSITKNRNTRADHTAWHYSEFYDPHKRDTGSTSSTLLSFSSAGLPENLRYLLNISRVFGQSSLEDVLRLNEYVDYVNIPQGTNLFSINELDDKIYIVLTGILQLNFQGDDGEFHMIKQLRSGDQIVSLLSFIDFVMGKQGVYRTVQTVALVDSEVMKIPMAAFGDILMSDPVSLAKGLQRTLRRVYEVIFTACHQILGLTQELIKEKSRLPVPPLDDIPVFVKPSKNICEEAARKLMTKLSMTDPELLADCSVLTVPKGFVLFEPGQNDYKSVVYVYEGELEVGMRTPSVFNRTSKEIAFYINADEIFGSLVFLTNDARQFSVRTSTKSIIVHIPDKSLIAILERYPLVVIPLIESIFSRLSPFARQMDFGIEWTYVESGQALFHTNDEPNATYLVLNGRLRSYISNVREQVEQARLVGQYGRFDLVGLVEMWTNRKRTKTVLAVRGTELAKIPRDFITAICRRHAKVAFQILQYLTRRMVNTYKTSVDISSMSTAEDAFASAATHCTVALFPTSDDVPINYIAKEFGDQYETFGKILILNATVVRSRLEEEIFTSGNVDSTLTAWLCSQETLYPHILYIADSTPTEWSVKCFHQADIIFVVVTQEGSKEISEIERMILSGDSLAKKELLICHRYDGDNVIKMPRWTKLWLEKRPWLDFHHHVFVESIWYNVTSDHIINNRHPFDGGKKKKKRNRDIARVVRWLTGNTFGLALGGGGAKGAAHIGFLREFHKIKLPIDFICGVSIGSFIGGLFAVYQDVDKVEKISKDWFFQLIDGEKYSMDLTLPFVSFFTGDSLNCSLMEIFGDLQIEDLRIPYIICTTDLTNNTIREHRCGSLWRFVRASMTIINYFPPICDPKDGHYLIDGGYTNLVPADILRKFGVRYIMAVDISSKNNTYRNTNYGDSISGINLLTHTLPVFSNVSVPSMLEIQERLNWAQSVVYLNLIKRMEASRHAESPSIVYIRMPIDLHTTSDFKRFDKIRDIGCTFAQRVLAQINPGDSIEVIWKKLKYNRGNQRFGSHEGLGDYNQSQEAMYDDDNIEEEEEMNHVPTNNSSTGVDLNEAALHLYSVSLHSSINSG